MDAKTILIIAALASPLVVIGLLAQTSPAPPPRPVPNMPGVPGVTPAPGALPSTGPAIDRPRPRVRPSANLEEDIYRAKRRLADLEKMTQEQWEAEQRRRREEENRNRPPRPPR